MNKLHKYILQFLAIDLAVSALVLIWLLGARRGAGEIALGDQPVVAVATKSSAVKEVPSVSVTMAADPSADGVSVGKMSAADTRSILLDPNRQAELQALRRDIQAAQARIDAEIDRQAQLVGEEAFRTEVKELGLAEFQKLFPEEYEKYKVKRDFNMRNAKMFVSKRERALSLLRPEGVTAEEYATLRMVYEYLLECDQNMLEGRPVKPLPEGLPERAELEELVENYARHQSGCTSEMLKTWQAIQDFEQGTYFIPYIIMDKAVVYREDQ